MSGKRGSFVANSVSLLKHEIATVFATIGAHVMVEKLGEQKSPPR
jgi:hypothetical protein